MTTDTKEAEARARAHELMGMTWSRSDCDSAHPDALRGQCDRITAELLSHAAALDELRADRDVAVSVAWNLRRDLAAAIAERDRLREALRKIAEHSCEVAHAHQGLCADVGLKSRCPSCRAGEVLAK